MLRVSFQGESEVFFRVHVRVQVACFARMFQLHLPEFGRRNPIVGIARHSFFPKLNLLPEIGSKSQCLPEQEKEKNQFVHKIKSRPSKHGGDALLAQTFNRLVPRRNCFGGRMRRR